MTKNSSHQINTPTIVGNVIQSLWKSNQLPEGTSTPVSRMLQG